MLTGKRPAAFPPAGVLLAMPSTLRAVRLGLILLLITAGTLLAAGWAMHQAKRQAMLDDTQRASQQLSLYANSLHTLIERYRALPAVLALDSELITALSGPVADANPDAQNPNH